MTNKMPLEITIFGTINILLGVTPTIFLIFESIRSSFFFISIFVFTFFGLVTESEFASFSDRFLQTIMERGSLIILYIFSLFLFWSGLAMMRKKPYSRKIAIVSIFILLLSWSNFHASMLIRPYLFHNVSFDVNASQDIIIITSGLLIYAFLLIRYLRLPKIREYFNDANIKFPLKWISLFIFIILIVIFIPIFGSR